VAANRDPRQGRFLADRFDHLLGGCNAGALSGDGLLLGKVDMKRKIAWALLIVSGIGWPLTQLTIAKEEPPIILALSWLAIILTALDGVWITEDQSDDD
jgi:hypothetical protein